MNSRLNDKTMQRKLLFGFRETVPGILAFLMLFLVLFSAFYTIREGDHDCSGENCPICACIAQCENALPQISEGMASRIAIVLPAIILLLSVCLSASVIMKETPVSRKVRLND